MNPKNVPVILLWRRLYLCAEVRDAAHARFKAQKPSRPLCFVNGAPPWFVKLNVNGAVNAKGEMVGVGIVARNRLGMILGLAFIPFVFPFTPRMTEALGFREA